jgi:threonine dehydratase
MIDATADPGRDPTLADIRAARGRVAGLAVTTPTVVSPGLGRHLGAEVACKLEQVQPTGSFKVRGAASAIRALPPEVTERGVVTASTGNHGRAVAHVAAMLGVPAYVCLSRHVPAGKVAALEALGCELRVGGDSQADALDTAEELAAEHGLAPIHPFDDPAVIAGQGTIGLELLEQHAATTTVLIPLSGGGLFAGVASAVHGLRPDVRLVGVSMRRAPVMAHSLAAGVPVERAEEPTLADSLQGGIGGPANRYTFRLVRDLLDEVVLLEEQEIWDGMRFAFDEHRWLLEGGGAVGVAALLAGRIDVAGPVSVLCTGANVETDHVAALAAGRSIPPG